MAEETVPDPFSEARLGPLTLRNRIIKAATFEGRTGNNQVGPETDRIPSTDGSRWSGNDHCRLYRRVSRRAWRSK